MKKAFLLLLFTSMNTWAVDPSICNVTSLGGFKSCLKEFSQTIKSIRKIGESPVSCPPLIAPKKVKIIYPPLDERFSEHDAKCEEFIKPDGSLGSWGSDIAKNIDSRGADSFFFKSDLAGMSSGVSACPNWSNLNNEQKKHFWVWVMASIAHIESTCKPEARNGKATNGVAVGLIQLNERASARKWRGPNCGVSDVSNPSANLLCGLDILEDLLKGKEGTYKGNGELWGLKSGSYWQKLKKENDGGRIGELISLHPFCQK